MRIDRQPGRGTTVCIVLCRADGAVEEDLAASSAGASRTMGSGATILVIGDIAVRRPIVATVEALGHRVLEAGNGPDDLSALEQKPDLLLADFAMPGMNGAEVAAAVRRRRPARPRPCCASPSRWRRSSQSSMRN